MVKNKITMIAFEYHYQFGLYWSFPKNDFANQIIDFMFLFSKEILTSSPTSFLNIIPSWNILLYTLVSCITGDHTNTQVFGHKCGDVQIVLVV